MGDLTSTLLMVALMGAAFYFLLIRPQQKRAKDQAKMQSALEPGSRVMISSGIFGTIKHMGERQAIIEIAPGVEMTVLRQVLVRAVSPEEDEFEYDDEPTQTDEPGVDFASTDAPQDYIVPDDASSLDRPSSSSDSSSSDEPGADPNRPRT